MGQKPRKCIRTFKKVIVDLVKKGILTLKKNQVTCLGPDWSKEGIGFLLLQKYCICTIDKAPVCCPEGWCLIFASSRFCIDVECRYAPIEGEAAAIAWALEECRIFVMGCPNLIVVTDHELLKGLFGDRDLCKIPNLPIIQTKRKNPQVQIYHPTLLWEVAQSLRCCFTQPTGHLVGTPKWIPDWTLPIRHHRVWRHGRLGQIDNSIIIIRGKQQCSAHLTRHYSCSWTQWPAIQKINRHHTKWIQEDTQPHCTRDPWVLGGEVPPQRRRWVSALGPQGCQPHFPVCKCTM